MPFISSNLSYTNCITSRYLLYIAFHIQQFIIHKLYHIKILTLYCLSYPAIYHTQTVSHQDTYSILPFISSNLSYTNCITSRYLLNIAFHIQQFIIHKLYHIKILTLYCLSYLAIYHTQTVSHQDTYSILPFISSNLSYTNCITSRYLLYIAFHIQQFIIHKLYHIKILTLYCLSYPAIYHTQTVSHQDTYSILPFISSNLSYTNCITSRYLLYIALHIQQFIIHKLYHIKILTLYCLSYPAIYHTQTVSHQDTYSILPFISSNLSYTNCFTSRYLLNIAFHI